MCVVNMYEAKTNLSKYVSLLEKGMENEIILARNGKEIAKISLIEKKSKKRVGAAKKLLANKKYDLSVGDEEIAEDFNI